MILWGLFILVLVGVSIGYFNYVENERAKVAAEREKSAQISHDRTKEELIARYEGTPSSMSQATIRSVWGEDTKIVGIMVRCDDGRTLTEDVAVPLVIKAGSEVDLSGVGMKAAMEGLAGSC